MSALPARVAASVSATRSSRVALLALACSICSMNCGQDAPAANRRPPGMVSSDPARAAKSQPVQGSAPDTERSNMAYRRPSLSGGSVQPQPSAAADSKDQEPPEKKARDYSAELSALLGSTVSCLTGRKAESLAAVTINVTAQVMPSGSISRADAQAPGLTPVELTCIQRVVSTLRLNGPVEAAPRSVSAQLSLRSQAAREAPQRKAAADKDDSDENPHDTHVKEVDNDPPEVQQRDEPVREAPEPVEPRDQPPHDTPADEQP